MSTWVLALWLVFAAAIQTSDLEKTQTLAMQRYGVRGAETVAAWRHLLREAQALPDQGKVDRVNDFFNLRILFQSDLELWGQEDYWATPLEFMGRSAGDCEDFAIAKYVSLQLLGIDNARLRLIYVRASSGSRASFAHMVLGFYSRPTDEPQILDNLIRSVRPASQRIDLMPVFSFNSDGLWIGGATAPQPDPSSRLSRWRDVLARMRQEGI